MTQARCFNCRSVIITTRPLEDLIKIKFPVFCCVDCSLKFPDNGTKEFEKRIKYMKKFINEDD